MSTLRRSIKLTGTVAVGLIVYASSIVQCASQTPDNVAIPKAAWERLESAINAVTGAIRAIRPTSTPAQPTTLQPTPTPPPTAASEFLSAQASEQPTTGAITPTPQVYLEGKWVTEWPKERIKIEFGRVEDRMFHDGQLSPEPDGTYLLTADHYAECRYHIALSHDRHKMFWVPAPGGVVILDAKPVVNKCRPATIFSRIRECCGEELRDRDCCGERRRDRECCSEEHRDRDCCGERHRDRDCCGERHRDRDCCGERHRDRDCCGERHRDQDCCGERHRDRDCCGERHRDRDCCGERHRDRDCCGERHRDRDCCGEGRRRETFRPPVWRCHSCGPCRPCGRWEGPEPF